MLRVLSIAFAALAVTGGNAVQDDDVVGALSFHQAMKDSEPIRQTGVAQ